MRLFGIVDGAVDRYERASWLTLPFDLDLSGAVVTVSGPYSIDALAIYVAGAMSHDVYLSGAAVAQAYVAGAVKHEVPT